MLKSMRGTFMIVSTIAIMASCASEDNSFFNQTETESSDFSELITSLDDYSESFKAEHPASPATRSGWKKFWRSVKADYCGYTDADNFRHETLSIATSRQHWKMQKFEENKQHAQEYLLTPSQRRIIVAQIDSLKQVYASDPTNRGAIHNAAILMVLLDDKMNFKNTDELARSTINVLWSLGLASGYLRSVDLELDINNFFKNIYSDDTDVMFDRLQDKHPRKFSELTILKKYIKTVETLETTNDITSFTEGYVSIINRSNISTLIKNSLVGNISIAPASYKLWVKIDSLEK